MPLIAPIAFGYIQSVMSSSTSFWQRHRSRIVGSLGLVLNVLYFTKDYLEHGPAWATHVTEEINHDPFLYVGLILLIPLFIVLGTMLHRAEREHERFQRLFEAARDGIYLRDADGTIRLVNAQFLEIHGLRSEDVIGERSLERLALTPEERKRLTLEMRQAILTGKEPPMTEAPFRRPDGTQGWLQTNITFIKEEGQVKEVLGIVRDITARKNMDEAVLRRDAILEAVGFAAKKLLAVTDWIESAQDLLSHLGQGAKVSRTYIFENHTGNHGELLTSQRFEWVLDKIDPQIDNPALQNVNYVAHGSQRWVDLLSQRKPVQGRIRDFPDSEQAVLLPQGIQSIVCVPIFVHDRWWGFIGFDECMSERLWSALEIDALTTAANILGTAIERQEAESQLYTSEMRYRTLFESVPVGLYRSTPDGHVFDANKTLVQIFGYPDREAFLAASASSLFVEPRERQRWKAEIDKMGIITDFVTQMKRFDGALIWVKDSARAIRDSQGQVLYYDGSLEDITERKRAEEALRRSQEHLRSSEERYKDLIEHANDAIYTLDNHGRFTAFNRKAEEITGYKLDEVLGRTYRLLVRGKEHHKARRAFVRNLRGEVNITEITITRKEGTSRVLELSSRPIWREGYVTGTQGIARDITERKNLEQLQHEFVSTVSHELRTPLTSIKGYVDLVLAGDAGPLASEQEEFLKIVSQNTTRLTHLINDLLDIQKLEAGRIEFEFSEIALEELLQEVAQDIRVQADQKGLSFRTELDAPLIVRADRERLAQAFINLLSNAIKYTPQGEVVLSAHQRDQMVIVSVTDTGIGLSEKDLQRLFQKFYRSENSYVRKVGGTGLGLAITKAILDRHNGKIEVASQLNKGSTFTVWLPALIPNKHGTPCSTVLVIEDELEIAKLISQYIQKLGYRTETASTAQEGLEKALKLKPQLITLDVLMPDMDGFTLMQKLKSHPEIAPIPVIFLSIIQDRLHGLRLGASAYLTKPIDEQKFSETVRNLLEPHGQPVLVADDDPDFARLLQRLLQHQGWSAEVAGDGEEAWEKLQTKPYQLVLLDKNMPKRSGLEVLQELRNHKALAHIPVIVISGTVSTEKLAQSAQVLGAKKFLSKKLSPQALVQEIVEVLEEKSQRA